MREPALAGRHKFDAQNRTFPFLQERRNIKSITFRLFPEQLAQNIWAQ
jgi:hypothetical protein